MFKSRRYTIWTHMSGLMLAALLVISPLPAAADDDSGALAISTVASFGCASGQTMLAVATVISEPVVYLVRIIVDIGPTRYMNAFGFYAFPVGGSTQVFGLSDSDGGGATNGTWPLPAGPDILVTMQLSNGFGVPMWESRVTLGSCDSNVLLNPSNGPVDQLLKNYGFEKSGSTAALASQWTANANDARRVCSKDVPIFVRTGECAYRFKGAGTLSQTYKTRPIAAAGDQLRLVAYVHGKNLAVGSTIRAVVSIPNQSDETIMLNVPPGDYEYQEIVGLPINITKPPDEVTVTIRKVGGGTLWVDDVMLLSVANAGIPVPLTLLTVPPAPISDQATSSGDSD